MNRTTNSGNPMPTTTVIAAIAHNGSVVSRTRPMSSAAQKPTTIIMKRAMVIDRPDCTSILRMPPITDRSPSSMPRSALSRSMA